jgi:adenosylcobinamide-GDP ribazoletransferase
VAELRLAVSFLTIIPLSVGPASATDLAGSFGWFPLIGFTLGAILSGLDQLLALVINRTVRSIVLIMAMAVITGALHLDGLADTADALAAGSNRSRALEILRDSRIGTFGSCAIFLVLALKIGALVSSTHSRGLGLLLAPGLARWAMVAVPYKLRYLREQGAGSTLLGAREDRNLSLSSAISLVAVLGAYSTRALQGAVVAIVLVWIFRGFYVRWLGGITGDLLGAVGEVVEAAALIAIMC